MVTGPYRSDNRTLSFDDGSFSFGRDMRGLFNLYPDTIVLLKFNYWIPL